jgi:hypothetical protein
MWRRRRRLQQLETEVAQGKAERAELRRRLDWFEEIAVAAGAAAPGAQPPGAGRQSTVPAAPPPNLLAAARDLRRDDFPVRLEVGGAEVIAVVGGPGDPREWWTAIWRTVGPEAGPETADAEEAPV